MELIVGRVAKSHGVHGELVVDVRTDEPQLRFAPGAVLTCRGAHTKYTVRASRWHGSRLLVQLGGVDDKTAADALRGAVFVVDSAQLPPVADPDEFYDHQLEGLTVRLPDGTVVGRVAEVLHSAAGELLSVRADDSSDEVLVPFVHDIVPMVSVAEGVIVIDPPEGLLA